MFRDYTLGNSDETVTPKLITSVVGVHNYVVYCVFCFEFDIYKLCCEMNSEDSKGMSKDMLVICISPNCL